MIRICLDRYSDDYKLTRRIGDNNYHIFKNVQGVNVEVELDSVPNDIRNEILKDMI